VNTQYTIVVLISGRGSNLQSLHKNSGHFRIASVVSNNPDALGIEFAKVQGLTTKVVPRGAYASLKEQKAAILQAVVDERPDLVVLAGFMQIIEPAFLEKFKNRVINIHPSLLPQLPGLDTHKRALESGLREHGCSVHMVDAGVDTGCLIAQGKVPVHASDTEEQLAKRVLEVEHVLYPWVVNHVAQGNIVLANQPHVNEIVRQEAKQKGFILPTI
jgi:phosphoribosylglycinamide formyltransferase-1